MYALRCSTTGTAVPVEPGRRATSHDARPHAKIYLLRHTGRGRGRTWAGPPPISDIRNRGSRALLLRHTPNIENAWRRFRRFCWDAPPGHPGPSRASRGADFRASWRARSAAAARSTSDAAVAADAAHVRAPARADARQRSASDERAA
eukprot:3925794-Prymnesium_polylepis.1